MRSALFPGSHGSATQVQGKNLDHSKATLELSMRSALSRGSHGSATQVQGKKLYHTGGFCIEEEDSSSPVYSLKVVLRFRYWVEFPPESFQPEWQG